MCSENSEFRVQNSGSEGGVALNSEAQTRSSLFALLNLPEQFALNAAALERAYITAQRQFHPDRFVRANAQEKLQAAQMSAAVNAAYHQLKSPVKRAQYLLEKHGIWVNGERDNVKPTPALLMEVMELREQLEAASDKDIEVLASEAAARAQQAEQALSDAFERSAWQEAAQACLRLHYLTKFAEDLRLRRAKALVPNAASSH